MTQLILTNAVYFKGNWDLEFNPKSTGPGRFNSTATETCDVQMMRQTHERPYFENEQVQVVEIPYAGKRFSMTVVLPKKGFALNAVEKDLTLKTVNNWIHQLASKKVVLQLPKFELSGAFQVEELLKKLGITDPFSMAKANFSRMSSKQQLKKNGNLYISAVVHKAFTKVNEQGTEAAAASATVIMPASVGAMSFFKADHPFLFFIRDTQTNTILFIGRLQNPSLM